jgi:hypothetical protein
MQSHRFNILDEIRAALNVSLAPLPPTLRAPPVPVRVHQPQRPIRLADLDRAGFNL